MGFLVSLKAEHHEVLCSPRGQRKRRYLNWRCYIQINPYFQFVSPLTTYLCSETSLKSVNELFELKSGSPEISSGGVQNKNIENPQTLPESRSGWTISRKKTLSPIRFLFYANGDKIGFAAITFASPGPDNPLFERRLKIDETENVTIYYLNEKNTYLRTHWNANYLILSRKLIFGRFLLFFFNISLISTNKQIAKLRG